MTNFNFIIASMILILSIIFNNKFVLMTIGNFMKTYFYTRIPTGVLIEDLMSQYNILVLIFGFVLLTYFIISIFYGIVKVSIHYNIPLSNLVHWETQLYYIMVVGMIPIGVFSIVIFYVMIYHWLLLIVLQIFIC